MTNTKTEVECSQVKRWFGIAHTTSRFSISAEQLGTSEAYGGVVPINFDLK